MLGDADASRLFAIDTDLIVSAGDGKRSARGVVASYGLETRSRLHIDRIVYLFSVKDIPNVGSGIATSKCFERILGAKSRLFAADEL